MLGRKLQALTAIAEEKQYLLKISEQLTHGSNLARAFFGFVLESVIAIPIGVLCGLNPTFMSAMTPFIALFAR